MNIAKNKPKKSPELARAPTMANPNPKSRLLKLIDTLPRAQQNQLLEFAEFLAERYTVNEEVSQPREITRPENESVIEAMKRLRESYPMLDPEKLINETSSLMSAHLMQGRSAESVIDELEEIFKKHYQVLVDEQPGLS